MATAESARGRTLRTRAFLAALADSEPWLVGPSLGLGLIVPRLLGPALAVAGLFWLVRWRAAGRLSVPTAGDLPIAILVLLLPITLWVTPVPAITHEQVRWFLAGLALYYILVNWLRTPGRERLLVMGVVGLGVVAALLAPLAVTWVTDIKLTLIPERVYRSLPALATTPLHPNVLAGGLVLALPIPLALLLFAAPHLSRYERLAALAAVLGISLILVLTKSRGALLGAAAAGLTLALLRWRRGWLGLLFVALLAGFLLWRSGLAPLAGRLTATGSIVGWPGRFEIWARGLYLVKDYPLTGIGMGAFGPVTNALYPYFLLGPAADVPHAHNLFLQVAVDLGLPGLIAWLALLLLAAAHAWRIYRLGVQHGHAWQTGLGAGLLAAHLALAVHGLLDAAVWGAHSGLVVWTLWAITLAPRPPIDTPAPPYYTGS